MDEGWPSVFKGIALFTPGGDLIYCLDTSKQQYWHLHLCASLQEILGLPEPPHFLVPSHTATVDRWWDERSQEFKAVAEVYPPVCRYQPLLNAAFGTEDLVWRVVPWQESACNPMILAAYRQQFPQLWQSHELVVRLGREELLFSDLSPSSLTLSPVSASYAFRLFISGNHYGSQSTLKVIYQLLEQHFGHPYTLKVIDIAQHPEEAERHQVAATPTLVRVYPEPVRRVVGELALADWLRVVQVLT